MEIKIGKLTIEDVIKVARGGFKVILPPEQKEIISKSRINLENLENLEDKIIYGVNTGFGGLSNTVLPRDKMAEIQKNLIISHACGVGTYMPPDVVRAVMLLRINSLAQGYSGVRAIVVETLIEMLNKNLIPAIPEKGSLGASGDLSPLSHMALPLIGLGEALYNDTFMPGGKAMEAAGIKPLELKSKEGLALINGTQAMTGIGTLALYSALNLAKLSDISAALTMEALQGITDAFGEDFHKLRPHPGQFITALNINKLLKNSHRITKQGQIRTQDAYSLRCIPQVHGASKDALNYVRQVLETEINSVTDNPVILNGEAVSGGHFHGQPVALAMDFMAIALAELANIAERRIERMVNPALSGLPPFLTEDSGLNSGFMIAQYTAAALVSENKVLAHPASVDSIPSSANQEDHVSMGTISARKAMEIYFNASRVIGIELFTAARAIEFGEGSLGEGTNLAYSLIRKHIQKPEKDIVMYYDIDRAAYLIDSNILLAEIEKNIKLDL